MKIFREKAGIISEKPIWICYHSTYMYVGDSLIGLLWEMATKWNNDHNLVG